MAVAAEAGPPNAKNNAASNANSAKKDPTPPAPYRYCMPTHAVYTPPKPTARKPLTVSFTYVSLLFYGHSTFCAPHLLILIFCSLDLYELTQRFNFVIPTRFLSLLRDSIHVNWPYRKWDIFRLRCKYPDILWSLQPTHGNMLISLILKVLFMRRHNRRHLWKEKYSWIEFAIVGKKLSASVRFVVVGILEFSFLQTFLVDNRKHTAAKTFASSRFDFLSSIFVILEFKLFSIECSACLSHRMSNQPWSDPISEKQQAALNVWTHPRFSL